MPNTTNQWVLASDRPYMFREWGEESVIYDRESGSTHLLDEYSSLILRRLSKQPVDLDTILDWLREDIGGGSREQLTQIAQLHLSSLQSLGIIVCLPGDHS